MKPREFLKIACTVFAFAAVAVVALPDRAMSQTATQPSWVPGYPAPKAPRAYLSSNGSRRAPRTQQKQAQASGNAATETVLYSFCTEPSSVGAGYCTDGNRPLAGLFRDSLGNLYGTTFFGGAYTGADVGGVIFKLDSAGNYSVLHNFCSVIDSAGYCVDGSFPNAGVIEDSSGNLYGTTTQGDPTNDGLIFKLDNAGYYSVLYNFCSQTNCTDGGAPYAGLVEDASGNLYGAASLGGATASSDYAGGGVVFKLDSAGNYTVLHSFCSQANCGDGGYPIGGLIEDALGSLYGTTDGGGAHDYGTVFRLDSAGNYTVLYSFCSQSNCVDGYKPTAALIEDDSGNLYGTASLGGAYGYGTVFKLDAAGNYTVLYSFCSQANCSDGSTPYAGLVEDASGNLYGTTFEGGPNAGASGGDINVGNGVVFKVDSAGNYSVIYNFCSEANCADGSEPWYAGLIQDGSGNLYGTTAVGGTYSQGTVFKLNLGSSGPTNTATSLGVSPSSVTVGSSGTVLITATITPTSGTDTPTGTVTFFNGTTQLNSTPAPLSNGVATYNYNPSSLAVGSYSITASYSGDTNFSASTSSSQPLNVTPLASYTLSVNPNSVTIVAGQSGQTTFTVTPQNGFNSQISFSCSGLPSGANCSFNPASVTPSGSNAVTSTLTITTKGASAAAQRAASSSFRPLYAALQLSGLMVVVVGSVSRKGRASHGLRTLAMIIVLAGFGAGLSSCGAGGSSAGGGNGGGGSSGTPPGAYTVTVTASASGSGASSQTATLTVTVTQ